MMPFERRELRSEKVSTTFWTAYKYYLVGVPALYFIFLVPGAISFESGSPVLEPIEAFNMIKQMFNFVLAGTLWVTNPRERSRKGAAYKFLIMIMAQQALANNIFGMALGFAAWYELPRVLKPEQISEEEAAGWHFKNRTIYIILGVVLLLTALTAFGQWKLTG